MAMRAQDIMTKNPTVVTPEQKVADAARRMKEEDVGLLPVVEASGSRKIVGVVTDRDIAVRCAAEGKNPTDCAVRDIMTAQVKTAKLTDDVDDVMKRMANEKVRRIPIVDDRGDLVGIIAQADVTRKARDDEEAEKTVEKISKPGGPHSQ